MLLECKEPVEEGYPALSWFELAVLEDVPPLQGQEAVGV
jgi:hypothetical protein